MAIHIYLVFQFVVTVLTVTPVASGSLHAAKDANFSAPDSLLSPDADTWLPTRAPSLPPTSQPTPLPTPDPTKTYKPTAAPVISWAPSVTQIPSLKPSPRPSSPPTATPTATPVPTATKAPTLPTALPSQAPTTWQPTHSPTLLPTSELEQFGQRLAIGLSFVFVVIAYAIHSLTKPSELAQRGLDHTLFRVREFRVEKRWGCKFCGFVKNEASSPECRQCGTNQLGEQEILPVDTAKGHPLESWKWRTPPLQLAKDKSDALHDKNNRGGKGGGGGGGKPARRRSSYSNHHDEPMLKGYALNEGGQGQGVSGGGHMHAGGEATRKLLVVEREHFPFSLDESNSSSGSAGSSSSGGGGGGGRQAQTPPLSPASPRKPAMLNRRGGGYFGLASELPVALALSQHGFVVTDLGRSGATLGVELFNNAAKGRKGWGEVRGAAHHANAAKLAVNLEVSSWGLERYPTTPTAQEAAGHHLEWCCSHGGVATTPGLPPSVLLGMGDVRKAFFPEKVAWFYERLSALRFELSDESLPTEHAITYPNSVLRDSVGFLNKVTPLQALLGKYRVQFVSGKSRSRSTAIEGELEEKWLQALFSQFSDPDCGVLSVAHDGCLELNPAPRSIAVANTHKAVTKGSTVSHNNGSSRERRNSKDRVLKRKLSRTERAAIAAEEQVKAAGPGGSDAGRLLLFSALGRAVAMALVQRSFVDAPFSPALCKLLVGTPLHFLDLLNTNQDLFQDLLKLMSLSDQGVGRLHLSMPETSTDGGGEGQRNAARDGVAWAGRGTRPFAAVDGGNRLEYVFRMMEAEFFLKRRAEFAAMRRALFEIVPSELLSVFDHKEFLMLLNGHYKASASHPDLYSVSV